MNRIVLTSEASTAQVLHTDENTGATKTLDIARAEGRCADCGHPLGGLSLDCGEWDRYQVTGRRVCIIAEHGNVHVQHRAGTQNRGVYHLHGCGVECPTCGNCKLKTGCSVILELDDGETVLIDDGQPR